MNESECVHKRRARRGRADGAAQGRCAALNPRSVDGGQAQAPGRPNIAQ